MRLMLLAPLILVAAASAQDADLRFSVPLDLRNYPQAAPKDAFRSFVTAIEKGRYDYLVAHLADPTEIDGRLRDTRISPERLAGQIAERYKAEPDQFRTLQLILADGEMVDGGETATFTRKDKPGVAVTFRKAGERWFLVNRKTPAKKE